MKQRSRFTIRTSDRRVFRRCLRKWDFQSSLRGNWRRAGTETNINFWFGSAIHFAMEDFHGYNRFGDPRLALWGYYQAFPASELPNGADACYELGMSMLSYYMTWYPRHNAVADFKTAWVNPEDHTLHEKKEADNYEPSVEQSFNIPLNMWAVTSVETDEIVHVINSLEGREIDLDEEYEWATMEGPIRVKYIPICYHGTMDRIVIDKYGRYWILDYKTAKGADTNKLDTDDQISAYLWAFEKWFGIRPYGFIYLQLTKDAVQEPRRLKSGELSVDKKQKTTYSLVKQEILHDYGKVNEAPAKIIQFLNHMATLESPEGDRFIRWDFVKRSEEEIRATERHIYGELKQMLNPDLYCYPSPTRDCIWDCPIRDLCIAQDREENDLCEEIMSQFEKRPRDEDGNIEPWRENIPWPEKLISEGTLPPSLEEVLQLDQCLKIEFESKMHDDDTGFTFQYEAEEESL